MAEFSSIPHSSECAGFPAASSVPQQEIDALLVAAEQHPLGTEFLTDGHLEAVAITFQVHAFTVDAARRVLRGE